MKKKLSLILNIVLGLAFIFLVSQRLPIWIKNSEMESQPAPSIKVVDLEGQLVQLPLVDGKPSVLFFWATWCGPCHYEMDQLQKSVAQGEISGDRIFAINIGESQDLVSDFVEKNKYQFRFYLDPYNSSSLSYHVQVTPTIVHVDSKGDVQWMTAGMNPMLIYKTKSLLN